MSPLAVQTAQAWQSFAESVAVQVTNVILCAQRRCSRAEAAMFRNLGSLLLACKLRSCFSRVLLHALKSVEQAECSESDHKRILMLAARLGKSEYCCWQDDG